MLERLELEYGADESDDLNRTAGVCGAVPEDYHQCMGAVAYVFLCNGNTEKECLDRSLFGTPEGTVHKLYLSRVAVGDQLFLYNYDTGVLRGPFTAQTGCCSNLVPDAFKKMKNRASWQVRVNATGQYCVPVTADDLSELGLLQQSPLGFLPPTALEQAQYQAVIDAFKRKNT